MAWSEAQARRALDVVDNKWVLSVLAQLSRRRMRYSELCDAVPEITTTMLTRTLRKMERDGLVERQTVASVPTRVDYWLTPLGRSLSEPLSAMSAWSRSHADEIAQAQDRFDSDPT